MKGIEIKNAFENAALVQAKSRRAEQEPKDARAKREEAAKNSGTKQQIAESEAGVCWVRGEAGNTAGTNPWNIAGNNPAAPNGRENANSQPGKTAPNGQKAHSQTDQNGTKDLAAANQNGIGANRIGQTNSLSPVNRQRMLQQKAKAKAKAKKKNLNYNRREISSQVLRANKLGSAARALASARTKVATLRRCVGTGQYDENELRIAINHAESIVKTAKKKMTNLKEEQIKEKRVTRDKQTNALKKQVKKQRIRAQRQQVKRELTMQRKQMERETKMKEMRYKQLKRRHRGEELADVAEADIKYIKDVDRYRRYGGGEGSGVRTDTTGTAALEIGDSAMRLSDLQRTEQALKYEEQQMDGETATFSGSFASGSMDFLVGDGISASGEGSADMGGAAADMAALGGSVDVSL